MLRWLAIVLMGCGSVPAETPDATPPLDAPQTDAPLLDAPMLDAPMPDVPPDAPGFWRLVQTKAARITQSTTELTVDRVGSQHLVIVAVQLFVVGDVASVTDSNDCNTYVSIPAAQADCLDLDTTLAIFYATNSCTDVTEIRATADSPISAIVAWEVAGLRADDPVDTAAVTEGESATPDGPRITTSTDGEFVVSIAIGESEITGLRSGSTFTFDHNTFDNGWAHLTDPAARAGTYQALWDQDVSALYCASAAAFKAAPPP